jgi:DNA-binding response OmpR family regulator
VRKKLRLLGAPGLIETVWGRGYVMRAAATVAA